MHIESVRSRYNKPILSSAIPKRFVASNSLVRSNTSTIKFGQSISFFPFNYDTLNLIVPNNTMRRIKPKVATMIEGVKVPTKGGINLNSWFVEPKGNKPVFLFLNGTNSNRTWQEEVIKFFDGQGYGALMPDYRGFGDTPGHATEQSLYEDAEASLQFLNKQGLKDKNLVLWGYSLGGAVARHIAPMNDFKFGIIDSAITNEYAIKNHFVLNGLADLQRISQAVLAKLNIEIAESIKIPFDNLNNIKEVKYPLLFLHSKGDEIVPSEMTEKQFALSQNRHSQLVITGKAPHVYRNWAFDYIKSFDESIPHDDYYAK